MSRTAWDGQRIGHQAGELQADTGPLTRSTGDLHVAAVRIDDLLDDREAQASSVLAGPAETAVVEALEHPRQLVVGDALAAIVDLDDEHALVGKAAEGHEP